MHDSRRRELRSTELPSPVKPEGFLSIDVMPFGEAQTLMMARDITRLYRADQIRRDFVANVSHELRTPVTVIRGYLEALAGDRARCPVVWIPVIAQLESQTQRMQRIIEDLLYLSRLEQDDGVARPEPVCVAELLSEIYQEAQTVEGGVRHLYALEMDATLCILAAQSELYSAFSNLVVNAVRYTGEGGVIRIRWYRDAEGAHLAVSDTGIGTRPTTSRGSASVSIAWTRAARATAAAPGSGSPSSSTCSSATARSSTSRARSAKAACSAATSPRR